ncbi:MAG: hypothetical protein GY872_10420, partial [Roseibacillus sp.]|nr:hypothetical protein [Roseibacillus sp.]
MSATPEQVRNVFRNRSKVSKPASKAGETTKNFKNGAMDALGYAEEEISTPEDALMFFSLDPREWEVVSFGCSVWQSGENNLYAIKGSFKPKKEIAEARDEIRDLIEEAKKNVKLR